MAVVELVDKIFSIPDLAARVAEHRKRGETVAHCHGVFDLLHPGHLRHLQAAAKLADILVVTITGDRFVNKGPGRPAFNQDLRAEMLAAISPIGYVGVNQAPDAIELILTVRPDIYVKGSDYVRAEDDPTGKIAEEERAIMSVGGRMEFTNEIVFSSSNLLNQHFSRFTPSTDQWLQGFRKRYSIDQVLDYIERAAEMRAVVIGEPIIDEYVFCNAIGKATKDPMLAVQFHSMETYAGGSLAVANHVAGLMTNVTLIAQVGEQDSYGEFMRTRLTPGVEPIFPVRSNAPTVQKRRFVDAYTNTRMLELYVMDDSASRDGDVEALRAAVADNVADADLVVVADYGHGMMHPKVIEAVVEGSRFLVLNAQANAGNRGFNSVRRYRRADYLCLALHEVEMETRLRYVPIESSALAIKDCIDCPAFTITRGKTGSVHFGRTPELTEVPSLTTHVVDRVGAGDAVLAATAPLVKLGAPWEVVGFVGNIAGALLVGDLGNRMALTRVSLIKAVKAMMQ